MSVEILHAPISMEPLSVPFANTWFTPNFDGLVSVRGLVRTEPEGLVIEFRRTHTTFGVQEVRRGEIGTLTVPWAEIRSISFRRRWLVRGVLVL
ncbi:MAG TPA: hypothetical protein VFR37_04440, partial [Longimicrobium sp.]|nr:hypothetical protein [Longimicrobium sp.]